MVKCLECGDKVIGRPDKKFCTDQCRSQYNNRLNKDKTNYMRRVNNILRRNRRIMMDLNPNGKAKVRRDELLLRGFIFEYHTHTYTTKAGKTYVFCYEHGYLPLPDELFALVINGKITEQKRWSSKR